MFVTAAMAVNAYFVVAYAFFHMFFSNLGSGVLMAAIAGIFVIVVIDMAGIALGSMVLVKAKVFFVIKCCRCPAFLYMAGTAVAGYFLVQGIARISVTTITLFYQAGLKQLMRELTDGTKGLHPFMVTMAGDTIFFD